MEMNPTRNSASLLSGYKISGSKLTDEHAAGILTPAFSPTCGAAAVFVCHSQPDRLHSDRRPGRTSIPEVRTIQSHPGDRTGKGARGIRTARRNRQSEAGVEFPHG